MTQKKLTPKKVMIHLMTFVFLIASGFILKEAVGEIIRNQKTKADLVIIQNEVKTLEEENKELEALKVKLADSDYVQNYARGKHLMSKSDEQVFILPKPKE